jgi:hypothetical protein
LSRLTFPPVFLPSGTSIVRDINQGPLGASIEA